MSTWFGWFSSPYGYDRQWALIHTASGVANVFPDAVRSWFQYHVDIWKLAAHLNIPHPFASKPATWFFQTRPTLFYNSQLPAGVGGCPAGSAGGCTETITSLGTVSTWWVGAVAVVVVFLLWALARSWTRATWWRQADWTLGAALSGVVAGFLPWFFTGDRTIYSFYTVAFAPWVIICIVVVLARVAGPDRAAGRWRVASATAAVLVVVSLAWVIWFWPVYTAQPLPQAQWLERMWSPGWR